MEVYEVFTNILSYSALDTEKITQDRYYQVVEMYKKHLGKALDFWQAFIKTKNGDFYTYALEELVKAFKDMNELYLTMRDKPKEITGMRWAFLQAMVSAVTGIS